MSPDDHDHAPGHSHAGHHHGPDAHGHGADASVGRLRIALGLTVVLLVAELVGGLLSNSLALLADAGHMLTDAGALGLSLFVAWFSRQQADERKTYGYLRWEILAALINGASLLLISGWITWEALLRLGHPEATQGGLMLIVAVAGLAVNTLAAWLLQPHGASSLNVRGAYLHILGDLLASVGTVVAALVIQFTHWLPADPIASLVTTLLIVRGAWALVRESVNVLLEATPAHIACDDVRAALQAIPGVASVHDLHVWTVTSGVIAMSAHAVVPDDGRHHEVLVQAHAAMLPFGIGHITVQIERTSLSDRERHLHA